MDTYSLLCFGDNHGNAESLRRVVAETEGEQFDAIVHTGDLTNSWFEGAEEGQARLATVEEQLERLAERGPVFYVLGNRDLHISPSDLSVGTYIPDDERVGTDDLMFTQDEELARSYDDTIWVNHYWHNPPFEFDGLGYLSGDTHNGVHYRNVVNTDFLYRTSDHGANEQYGGYFTVEATPNRDWNATFHALGSRELRTCPRHGVLGRRVMYDTMTYSCWACHNHDEAEMYETLQHWLLAAAQQQGVLSFDEAPAEAPVEALADLNSDEIRALTDGMPRPIPEDWMDSLTAGEPLSDPQRFKRIPHSSSDDDQSALTDF